MRTYSVSAMARLSGVSVRALHHYDQIGLLKPAFVGTNGYRHYGQEELLRLQQILLHRRLGLSLTEIATMLEAPGFDTIEALEAHRARVIAGMSRSADILRTIDRTIARLKGDETMQDKDLYGGLIAPEKQAEYEDWLIARGGEPMRERIGDSKTALAARGPEALRARMADLEALQTQIAGRMRDGVPPEAEELASLLSRHRDWVGGMWGRPCPPQAYAGLADLYLSHPDFRARYEAIAPGFAEFLAAAMKGWAARELTHG